MSTDTKPESAREAFLYLLSFSTLATWATSLGALVFDLINHWLPDAVSRAYVPNLRVALNWEMARIGVAFPIYLLATALAVKETIKYPDRLQSGVRKWLTYIALLGTAGAMICDLTWFLDYLLAGEITLRFVLKSATVMAISAGIFSYYLSSLRSSGAANVATSRRRNRAFAAVSAAAATAAFCTGLLIAGTPRQQRTVEADRVRVQDLRQIAQAVKGWHMRNAALPDSLNTLVRAAYLPAPAVADPLTRVPFEYHPRTPRRYELCATFQSPDASQPGVITHSEFWHYSQGKTCFVLDASEQVPW